MASSSMGALPIAAGISAAAFASGFGVCLFNLDTVGECLTLAHSWVDIFRDMGNQIIVWGMHIVSAVLPHKA